MVQLSIHLSEYWYITLLGILITFSFKDVHIYM